MYFTTKATLCAQDWTGTISTTYSELVTSVLITALAYI